MKKGFIEQMIEYEQKKYSFVLKIKEFIDTEQTVLSENIFIHKLLKLLTGNQVTYFTYKEIILSQENINSFIILINTKLKKSLDIIQSFSKNMKMI